jgi:hypothetical protein
VIMESLHRELLVREIAPAVGSGAQWPESRWIKIRARGSVPGRCTGKRIWTVRSSTKVRWSSYPEGGARGLIPRKPHRRVERMTETLREKCRFSMSRRIQKRCTRFKPHNSRRKRTRQVPKALGPSILEDRCQRSKPTGDLDTGSSRRRSRETRSPGSQNCETIDTVHQGGHVASGQGSGKIPKGCGSSIQWDHGHRFKSTLDR